MFLPRGNNPCRPFTTCFMCVLPRLRMQVAFILQSLSDMLGVKVRRSDVLSTWTGIRPLASNPKATSTQGMVRDHSEHEQMGAVNLYQG